MLNNPPLFNEDELIIIEFCKIILLLCLRQMPPPIEELDLILVKLELIILILILSIPINSPPLFIGKDVLECASFN